jgi:hypothetical protein
MSDKNPLYDYWKTVNCTKGNHYPKKVKEKQPFNLPIFIASCVIGGLIWWVLIGQY